MTPKVPTTPSTPPPGARAARRYRRAFSLVELLVVLGIIILLIGLLLPVVSKARRAAAGAKCLSNLRQIAVAFHVYAQDNLGRFPDPGATDTRWDDMLDRYLRQPDIYRCPADEELFPSIGNSYDWRDTGDPDTTLAGCPTSDARARNAVLAFDALPHWHTKGKMNVAFTDTSAMSMDVQEGLADLMDGVKKEKQKHGKGNGNGNGNGNSNN